MPGPSRAREKDTAWPAAGDEPTLSAFMARGTLFLVNLARILPGDALARAAQARTSCEFLLEAVGASRTLGTLALGGPLAPALLRGIDARARLLATEGRPLGAVEVARLLGVTPQAVNKRRLANTLLALSTGKRGYLYPSWQLRDGAVLPGLEHVLRALRGHDAWMRLAFFLTGDARLDGRTPLAALRAGHGERVLGAARAYGEQGAA